MNNPQVCLLASNITVGSYLQCLRIMLYVFTLESATCDWDADIIVFCSQTLTKFQRQTYLWLLQQLSSPCSTFSPVNQLADLPQHFDSQELL